MEQTNGITTPGGTRESENPPVVFSTAARARILEAQTIIHQTPPANSGVYTGVARMLNSEDSWQGGESSGEVQPDTLNLHPSGQTADRSVSAEGLSRETEQVERAPEAARSEGPPSKGQKRRKRRKLAKARRKETEEAVKGASANSSPLAATAKRNRSVEVTPTETDMSLGPNAASSSDSLNRRKRRKKASSSPAGRHMRAPHARASSERPQAGGVARAQSLKTGATSSNGGSAGGRKLNVAGRSTGVNVSKTPLIGGVARAQIPNETGATISKGCSSSRRKVAVADNSSEKKKKPVVGEREKQISYKGAVISSLTIRIGKAGNDNSMTDVECKHCESHLLELAQAANACIQVEGCELKNGTFMVKCSSQQTYEWISMSVPKIPPLEIATFEVFRATKQTRAVCWIPGKLGKTADVLARLRTQNPGLETNKWTVHSHKERKNRLNQDGSTLVVSLDKGSAEAIKSGYEMRPYLHLGRIQFRFNTK